MQPQKCWRIDLGELKALIVKKLGSNKSKQYFYYLNKFLGQKLSKNEFDKLCLRVLGRENIELHNQFIQSILKNACQAKTPPPIPVSGRSNSVEAAANSSIREDGHEQRAGILPNRNQSVPIWSNGTVPSLARKSRTAIHDQKLKDRPSPLGPNEKLDRISHQSICVGENGSKVVVDNGNTIPCDYQRPLQHLQSVSAELPMNNLEETVLRQAEKQIEDGEEANKLNYFRRPLLAPLGIPMLSAGMGGPCKSIPMGHTFDIPSYFDSGGLSDSEILRKRMELIAISEGLGGVSIECANVLNNVLDVYLKRLIRSCVDLVGARSTYQSRSHFPRKQQIQGKPINGIWPNNHLLMQNGSEPAEVMQEQKPPSISLLDFKIAMELNPKQIGGDWPLRLEKICMHPFEQ